MEKKEKHGGARPGAGRKKRETLGLPAIIHTSVDVEREVVDKCRELHGSLANALRFASKAGKFATVLQK